MHIKKLANGVETLTSAADTRRKLPLNFLFVHSFYLNEISFGRMFMEKPNPV